MTLTWIHKQGQNLWMPPGHRCVQLVMRRSSANSLNGTHRHVPIHRPERTLHSVGIMSLCHFALPLLFISSEEEKNQDTSYLAAFSKGLNMSTDQKKNTNLYSRTLNQDEEKNAVDCGEKDPFIWNNAEAILHKQSIINTVAFIRGMYCENACTTTYGKL